ncbi:MAG TPA: CHAT domain-containing protein [Thermoanaerobaculia bacterium]|nr:CHAT domain-containing protein [Thermoanaerobaculia bacterium]
MAAFLEGKLAPGEVTTVANHLRECADCRTVTGETARFTAEEDARTQRPRAVLGWKGWAAAAAAAAIVATIPLLRRPAPLTSLIDASPREYRWVEGRLSGFRWAPFRGGARNASATQTEHELVSVAHEVLALHDDAVETRHAAGVAQLLIDQYVASRDALARTADESKHAAIWNDLAAARLAVAVHEERMAELPFALDAANRAIELDPRSPEAHFNRALILERMGTHEAARQAWKRYLALEPNSEWSNEAHEHLRKLGAATRLEFDKEIGRAAGDRPAIATLVRRFPQQARLYGEDTLLGEWADARVANDAVRAAERLVLVRAIAEELFAANGERLLLDVVTILERTPSIAIAEAHRRYRDARGAAKERRHEEAEKLFHDAEPSLRAAGSPLANAAAYFAAQCAFDLNRAGESDQLLQTLRPRIDPAYRALSAGIEWTLARNANAAADWGTAVRYAAQSSATFSDLGERGNAATTATIRAAALERIGATDLAWRQFAEALAQLDGNGPRIASILHAAAVGLAAADHYDAAEAVMDVAIETESNPQVRTVVLTVRARLAERAGNLPAAHRWLGEARAELKNVTGREAREARNAQIEIAAAVLQRASDPSAAISALDASISFFEGHDLFIYLPDAYLQRARAHRAAGRTEDAVGDYRAALREIDRQRENVSPGAVTVAFLDVAAQTIDEIIDLHLERGEIAEAFAVADRAHALAARDYRPASVPDGVAVVEYAVLPHAVAIFCVTREGIAAARVPIERKALSTRVLSFASRLQARENVRAEAEALNALLIAPVSKHIGAARELVIVPDRLLHMLPFSALHDGRQYLIQDYALRVAQSIAMTDGRAEARPASNAIVIADPRSDLPLSRSEAERIAAMHGATILEGKAATRARVIDAIAGSTLVHYAGHADSNAESYGALLLASEGNDSGLLSASDIARLDLRARPLVVLSACGTLRGETTHVAGMPSLARAFLTAGASAVVGTLWEIDDDTAAFLFIRFHESLDAGEVPAGALRAAQIAMLQSSDPRMQHPASWSAVEVLSNL